VLQLSRSVRDAVVAHARRDHPDECCGVLPGKGGQVTRIVEMENADRSPTGFSFDSAQWLALSREMDERDEDFLVVYHSHTMTEAAPSRTDIGFAVNALGPDTHWLLVSTREPDVDEVRSFTIGPDGTVTEEEVALLDG
jgi:proteasome lid subunit RPN8/RPN11